MLLYPQVFSLFFFFGCHLEVNHHFDRHVIFAKSVVLLCLMVWLQRMEHFIQENDGKTCTSKNDGKFFTYFLDNYFLMLILATFLIHGNTLFLEKLFLFHFFFLFGHCYMLPYVFVGTLEFLYLSSKICHDMIC